LVICPTICYYAYKSMCAGRDDTSSRQRRTLRSFRRDTRSSVSNSSVSGTASVERDQPMNCDMLSRAWNEPGRAAEWYDSRCFDERHPPTRVPASGATLLLSATHPSTSRCQSHSDESSNDIRLCRKLDQNDPFSEELFGFPANHFNRKEQNHDIKQSKFSGVTRVDDLL